MAELSRVHANAPECGEIFAVALHAAHGGDGSIGLRVAVGCATRIGRDRSLTD
jgi:hypothetical protein